MSKNAKRTLSIVSVLVFVGCCAAMIADFNLWWLPIVALPFLMYGNWNFNGTWDTKKMDKEAERLQDEEPTRDTWPYSSLEATHSSDYEKEVERLQNPPTNLNA